MMPTPTEPLVTGTPVLITTAHRGVFFGTLAADKAPAHVELTGARCAICFGTTRGFLELADTGPTTKSRIGSQVEHLRLYDITSITRVSEAARAKWESA